MLGFNLQLTKRHFKEVLLAQYSEREASQLMRILVEDLFDIDLKQELLHPELRIDERQHYLLQKAVEDLMEGRPVQYVTGKAHFDGLVLEVDESVLIPRPETEELVQILASTLRDDQPWRIWDLGTGSGCIAIALAKRFPLAKVWAYDVSEAALATAKHNAERNNVELAFVCEDLLDPTIASSKETVDIVVSNPPYIRDSERVAMEANVLEHEPEIALFVTDEDPLVYYRNILAMVKPCLSQHGVVWFEINEAMGEAMLQLCRDLGYEGTLFDDYAGKNRFVKAVIQQESLSLQPR